MHFILFFIMSLIIALEMANNVVLLEMIGLSPTMCHSLTTSIQELLVMSLTLGAGIPLALITLISHIGNVMRVRTNVNVCIYFPFEFFITSCILYM